MVCNTSYVYIHKLDVTAFLSTHSAEADHLFPFANWNYWYRQVFKPACCTGKNSPFVQRSSKSTHNATRAIAPHPSQTRNVWTLKGTAWRGQWRWSTAFFRHHLSTHELNLPVQLHVGDLWIPEVSGFKIKLSRHLRSPTLFTVATLATIDASKQGSEYVC